MECEEGLKEFLFLLFFGFVVVFHLSFLLLFGFVVVFHLSCFLLSTLFLFLSPSRSGKRNIQGWDTSERRTARSASRWRPGESLIISDESLIMYSPSSNSGVGGPKWRTPPGLCPDRNLGRGRKDDFGKRGRAM